MKLFARIWMGLTAEGRAFWRAQHWWNRAVLLAVLVAFAFPYGEGMMALWQGWTTGIWPFDFYVAAAIPPLQALVTWFIGVRWLQSSERASETQQAMRQIHQYALAGDETLAPRHALPASPADGATEPASVPDGRKAETGEWVIGPLRKVAFRDAVELRWWAALDILCALLMWGGIVGLLIVFAALPVAPATTTIPGLIAFVAALAVWGLLATVGGFSTLRWASRLSRRQTFVADSLGIRPQGATLVDQRDIAWQEVKAFIVATWDATELYALESDTQTIAWMLTSASSSEERKAHALLAHLALAHASVPLRNLSGYVTTLGGFPTGSVRAIGEYRAALAASRDFHQSVRQAGQADALPKIRRVGISRLVLRYLLLGVALTGGLYLATLGARFAQGQLYQTYIARIHAESPLFHDSLSRDDGQWPVHPTARGGINAAFFHNGAYQLTGGVFSLAETPGGYYGDVAVELTVQQFGHADQFDGVGLALQTQFADWLSPHTIIITISQDGGFSAEKFDMPQDNGEDWIVDQQDSAIHAGVGARNTLLVLIRGHEFICYVNGQYVGSYADPVSQPGYIDLFNGDAATVASFSNFTIYPGLPTNALDV